LWAFCFNGARFNSADTHIVGQVQAAYLLQVPFYLIGMLFVRCVTALRSTQVMVWGNIINLMACVVLTYWFMRLFGVVGIALATSAMYGVSCVFPDGGLLDIGAGSYATCRGSLRVILTCLIDAYHTCHFDIRSRRGLNG
jgi:peptidoglycan biosynthesis protein MviN/MurJ (putative lipid II flippase)